MRYQIYFLERSTSGLASDEFAQKIAKVKYLKCFQYRVFYLFDFQKNRGLASGI